MLPVQIVAASSIANTDSYDPSNVVCLDPIVYKERDGDGTMAWCDESWLTLETSSSSTPSYFSDAARYEVGRGTAVLPLESTIKKRAWKDNNGGGLYLNKMTDKEWEAAAYFRSLLLGLYGSIAIDDLPAPGVLRRRKERLPLVLLHELVHRGRASPKPRDHSASSERDALLDFGALLDFVFVTAPNDIFRAIVRQM